MKILSFKTRNHLILLLIFSLIAPGLWAQNKNFGIINLSVSNMRDKASFSSEMVTQTLLGTPVRILNTDGWIQIETPDGYNGWVHRVAVVPTDSLTLSEWNKAEKVIVTSHYGFTYSQPNVNSQVVSDIVSGDRLKWKGKKKGFYIVEYPDGKTAYIPQSISMRESDWRRSLKQDPESILETAYTLMGIPYLWGGTSAKGVDCSGYVRTILFMHDLIIPRDATPQSKVGEYIEIAPNCANLIPGDFIFFGSKPTEDKKERVSHVGIYVGNGEFIHSQGNVHVSSLIKGAPNFDEFNLNRLLYARRILPYIGEDPQIETTLTNPLYLK